MSRTFFSNVRAIAYKEAAVLRHDKPLLSLVVVQPVVMLLLFGLVLSNKPINVPWVVLDRSDSPASRRLVAEIQATGYFVPPVAVSGYDEGRAALRRGAAVAFLVLPSTLERDVALGRPRVQLLLDGSDPVTAARVGGYVAQVAAVSQAAVPAGIVVPGRRDDPRFDRAPGGVDLRQQFRFNPTLSDRTFFLSALAGMLLTNLCLSVTSLSLVGERESGTWEQLLALPTRPIEMVLGKLVPYVGISYVVFFLATTLAGLAFGLWPAGSWLDLVVVTLPFVLASLSIGVFVSAVARTSAQAVFITVFFIMPSFVLSGMMFPYQLMATPVRLAGGLLPLRWFQIALRRVIERGAGLGDLATPILALVLFFGAMLLLIRWCMKPRLG